MVERVLEPRPPDKKDELSQAEAAAIAKTCVDLSAIRADLKTYFLKNFRIMLIIPL